MAAVVHFMCRLICRLDNENDAEKRSALGVSHWHIVDIAAMISNCCQEVWNLPAYRQNAVHRPAYFVRSFTFDTIFGPNVHIPVFLSMRRRVKDDDVSYANGSRTYQAEENMYRLLFSQSLSVLRAKNPLENIGNERLKEKSEGHGYGCIEVSLLSLFM